MRRPPFLQVLVGAQVYEQQKATHHEINELLSLWKTRHVQFMTAQDDRTRPISAWLRRRDPLTSTDVHSYRFGRVDQDGAAAFDSAALPRFAVKRELRRTWPRLLLGEGKAENQNNMITALFGEVVNILDMNQVSRPLRLRPLSVRGGHDFGWGIISWEKFVFKEGSDLPPAKMGALAVQCVREAV